MKKLIVAGAVAAAALGGAMAMPASADIDNTSLITIHTTQNDSNPPLCLNGLVVRVLGTPVLSVPRTCLGG